MSHVRLWDNDFHYLDGQDDCPLPTSDGDEMVITVKGDGALHRFVKDYMQNGDGLDLHITIDPSAENPFWWRRVGGKVLELETEERRCECRCECRNGRIITTTIRAALPLRPEPRIRLFDINFRPIYDSATATPADKKAMSKVSFATLDQDGDQTTYDANFAEFHPYYNPAPGI